MNEKEIMKQLHDLRARMEEEAANALLVEVAKMAEVFYTSAVALSKLYNMFQGKAPQEPEKFEEEDDNWDEDDIEYMDATVLYAVPGKGVQLMEEEEAMSRFPDFEDEQTFHCVEIAEDLVLHYMEHTWESEDDITITDPVYIARVSDDRGECEELTAMDFLTAMFFLDQHAMTITGETGRTVYGYWLPKKEDYPMNFEQFKAQVIDEMRDRFPELDISLQEVSKLQGESYIGMAVRPKDSNIAATTNLKAFFEDLGEDFNMDDVMDQIAHGISDQISHMPQFDERVLNDYEQMKEKLTLQMIPTAGNEEKLSEIPHRNVEDMAIVYRFEMSNSAKEISSILVTDSMLRSYGITADQLHEDALEAAVQTHPATLRNMTDVMRDLMGDAAALFAPDEPSPMWVASVEGGQNGACAIQYPDFLDQAAETLGGDFYVLPSSIHEVLLVADDGSMDLSYLEAMVRSVNETEVAPADRLSDHVFHYDSEEHIFENARAFEVREAVKEEAMLADEPAMTFGDDASDSRAADTITVLLVEPHAHPKVIEARTGLEDLQQLVGGDIEVVYPFEDNVGLIVNEEGKINGLPLNRALRDEKGEIYDVIAGPFLVTGLTEDSFGSLTQEQIGKFEDLFHQPEVFMRMGRSIMAIPLPEEQLAARENAKAKASEEIGAKPKHRKPERDDH